MSLNMYSFFAENSQTLETESSIVVVVVVVDVVVIDLDSATCR